MSEKEDEKIIEYRHQLNRKIDQLMETMLNAKVVCSDGTMGTSEIFAMRAGAQAALATLNDIVLGAFDEIFPFCDAEFGLKQNPKRLTEYVYSSASEYFRLFASMTENEKG